MCVCLHGLAHPLILSCVPDCQVHEEEGQGDCGLPCDPNPLHHSEGPTSAFSSRFCISTTYVVDGWNMCNMYIYTHKHEYRMLRVADARCGH